MEITAFELYWILKLDTIRDSIIPFITISAIVLIVGFVGWLVSSAPDNDCQELTPMFKKFFKISLPSLIFTVIAIMLIPSTKQACVLLVVPPIINNEQVQKMPQQILDLGTEWLEELKPQKGQNQ